MRDSVGLSVQISKETRKKLKKIAIEEEKSMADLIERMIMLKWEQINKEKNGSL